jgi:hypothetical protein
MARLQRVALYGVAAGFITGCAATGDIASDGSLGGGHYESKMAPGIYRVSVRTNLALWMNISGARSAWSNRAESLCGSAGFLEADIIEDLHVHEGGFAVPWVITTRSGYAVCKDTGLSGEEAMTSIGRRPK